MCSEIELERLEVREPVWNLLGTITWELRQDIVLVPAALIIGLIVGRYLRGR